MSSQRANIAVVGIGAIGGSVAADLADLGRHDLQLCVRTPIDELRVRHPQGESEVHGGFRCDPREAKPAKWVLLATKAHQSAAAQPWLTALCEPGTVVAVLQNGVDHVERIAKWVPEGTEVLPVVIQLPAEKTAPGVIAQARDGLLLVPGDETGRRFSAIFDGARTSVRATDDFLTQAFWKLLSNAALGGVCALTVRENGVAADPRVRELVMTLMREVVEVGRAEGAQLPDDAPEKAIDLMLRAAGNHWSSITVDRREGRPMEWEVRNEVVGRLGRKHGIATPMNDAITTLLRAADKDLRAEAS